MGAYVGVSTGSCGGKERGLTYIDHDAIVFSTIAPLYDHTMALASTSNVVTTMDPVTLSTSVQPQDTVRSQCGSCFDLKCATTMDPVALSFCAQPQ
jgi:hypothetical protein